MQISKNAKWQKIGKKWHIDISAEIQCVPGDRVNVIRADGKSQIKILGDYVGSRGFGYNKRNFYLVGDETTQKPQPKTKAQKVARISGLIDSLDWQPITQARINLFVKKFEEILIE